MKIQILFPCNYYNLKEVDSEFLPEAQACNMLGIKYYLMDFDTFTSDGILNSTIDFNDDCTIIYRGWMLKPQQYELLSYSILLKSNSRVKLINDSNKYINCHCFPNVYPFIEQYTPKIHILTGWDNIYDANLEFDFFLKDYVKSAKTADGIERISKDIRRDELVDKIATFVKERGNLMTGNIVLKEFVNLKKYRGETNEWRVFYFNGYVMTYIQNSYLETPICPPTINLIEDVGKSLYHMSNFFTVDFALTDDNKWIVIETGDGQVSGLPNGTEISFYNSLLGITN